MTSALLTAGEPVETTTAYTSGAARAHDDDYVDVHPLCNEMRHTGDEVTRRRLRARVITRCLPLADHIACRFAGKGEPTDDLTQVARLGLIKAVDRYDPDTGPFVAYAVPTIMGDVRRYFRDHAWGIHVPRGVKDLHLRVRATIGPLAQRLGRAPTASEVADELGADRDDVVQSVQAAYAYRPLSLDVPIPAGQRVEPSMAQHGAEDPRYRIVEDALTVSKLVRRLTEREQLILRLRFCEDLPQSQIGKRLGVSQVQVSRLLAATLQRLRDDFSEGDLERAAC